MKRLAPLAGPLALLALWQLAYLSGAISTIILPSLVAVAAAAAELLFGRETLWADAGLTVGRTVSATLISALMGIPLGLLMGVFAPVRRLLSFLIDFFRSIPPIALFPLFILIFGLTEASMVAVPVYGCFLVLTVSSAYGVGSTPVIRREVAAVLRLSAFQTFRTVVLPSALPHIIAGLRVAISLSLVLTIVVEMLIGTNDGLGRRIYVYHISFDSPEMYFCIVFVGGVGYLLNLAFVRIERSVLHWSHS
jgi:NitT/TauT family transport system permease protein